MKANLIQGELSNVVSTCNDKSLFPANSMLQKPVVVYFVN